MGAKSLYRKHCAADRSEKSLETDEGLIFNLIRGLFDRQLVAFLTDKKIETITHLREVIDFYYHCVKPFPRLTLTNKLRGTGVKPTSTPTSQHRHQPLNLNPNLSTSTPTSQHRHQPLNLNPNPNPQPPKKIVTGKGQ